MLWSDSRRSTPGWEFCDADPRQLAKLTTTANTSPSPRGWFSWLFGLAVVATVVAVVRERSEGAEFARQLERAEPRFLVLALGFQVGTYLTDAAIVRGVLAKAGHREKLLSFVPLVLAKLFMDQAIPSGGISGTMLVIHALDSRRVPRPVVSAAVLVGLLAHYLAHALAMIAALATLAWIGRLVPLVLVPAGLFTLVALLVPSLLVYLHRRGEAPVPKRIARLPIQSFLQAISGARRDLVRSVPLLTRSATLELMILALDGLTLWALLQAVGDHAPVAPVMACYVLAEITRILGIVPGGLGPFEAACVALLDLVGVSLASALTATLLHRGLSLLLPLVPGLLFAHRERRGSSA